MELCARPFAGYLQRYFDDHKRAEEAEPFGNYDPEPEVFFEISEPPEIIFRICRIRGSEYFLDRVQAMLFALWHSAMVGLKPA